MPRPIIRLKSLSKNFKNKQVLKNINLDIYENEIFSLIGVSGAGKTTLLRSLIGFYAPDSGSVYMNNRDVSKHTDQIKRSVGFAAQEGSFYEGLTVFENLKYFGKLYGLSDAFIKTHSDQLLNSMNLIHEKKTIAKELSGGMKRRLDIACALIHNPPLLILDEPSAGLDPILRKHILELIHRINKSGRTIVVSSHLLGDVEKMSHRVGIISDGNILDVGTPTSLRAKYSRNEEIVLETFPGDYKRLITKLHSKRARLAYVTYRDHQLVIYTPDAEHVLRLIMNIMKETGEHLIDVDVNRPSLSEVFEALTKKKHGTDYGHFAQLRFSVQNAFRKGHSKEQIRNNLLQKKWDSTTVEKVLSELP
ncbi:ABC transporter ATP-binding protein [Nanoarchaeota archaeon]